MKIVSWNCLMDFRTKRKYLSQFNADIYVIPECEDPNQSDNKKYKKFASNHLWVGENKDKGLGIFAKEDINLEPIEHDAQFQYFIPARVDDTFNLLAVWAMKPYIRMIHDFYQANRFLFNKQLVMCGDLNSSVKLDEKYNRKTKNFNMLLHYLKKDGLVDAYHFLNREKQGKESEITFFQNKKLNSPFHIDHVFTASYIIKSLEIKDNFEWINRSDHLPLVFEIDETKF